MALFNVLARATYTDQTLASPEMTMPGNLDYVALYCDPVGMTNPAQELDIRIERFDVAVGDWVLEASARAIGGLYAPKGGGTPVAPARVGVRVSAVDLRGLRVRGTIVVTGTITMAVVIETTP
jgi:hypothetical protein